MAKEFTLKMVIQAIDQVTAPVRKMSGAFNELVRRANLDRLAAALVRVREKLATVASAAADAGRRMRDMGGSAFAKITAPLGLLGGFAVRAAANLETLEVAFESMLGGADAAKAMVKNLAEFAAHTPFQLDGVGAAARQLLSFGVAQGDVMNSLKFLGDIAAGANVPLENMASIFGKAKAKGKAMTEELLQLSEQGVPIIDVLAKKLGRSKSEIFELASAGRISFATFAAALQSMSAEGGIFADQMKKQSETLFGQLSSLMDAVTDALAEVGKQIVETFNLKENIAALTAFIGRLAKGFREFAKEHPGLAKIIFILGGVAAATGPVLIAVGAMASVFGVMATGLALVITPLGGIITLIALLAAGVAAIYANWDELSESFTEKLDYMAAALDVWGGRIGAFLTGLWEDLTGSFDQGFIQGISALIVSFSPAALFAKGVNAMIEYLTGVDLAQIGAAWVKSIGDGIAGSFGNFASWISQKAGPLASLFGVPEGSRPAGQQGAMAPAVSSALTGGQTMQGAIAVEFRNAPPTMSIASVKADKGLGIDVDAGYAMAVP